MKIFPGAYQNEQAVGGEFLMSRDGGEHREDQAAEDQDEPEQKHKTGVKQDDINGLTSSTTLTKPSFPLVPNRLCTKVELFLCDKLLNPFWQ